MGGFGENIAEGQQVPGPGLTMAGRGGKGEGKGQADGVGSVRYCFEGLGRKREECFCVTGTLPLSSHLILTLSLGVDTVTSMAYTWGN